MCEYVVHEAFLQRTHLNLIVCINVQYLCVCVYLHPPVCVGAPLCISPTGQVNLSQTKSHTCGFAPDDLCSPSEGLRQLYID